MDLPRSKGGLQPSGQALIGVLSSLSGKRTSDGIHHLRRMYESRAEHGFSRLPQEIDIGSAPSLLAALIFDGSAIRGDG